MPSIQAVQAAQCGAKVSGRAAAALRRSAVVAGALGLTAGSGLFAGSALASGGLEPGNLTLNPATGSVSLTPTFATADGCPAGFQGSAQVSIFAANGAFISRISNVVPLPISAFHGALEGNIGAILTYAGVRSGGTSQWAVGCYTQGAGTGRVRWDQYTVVRLSADGKTYSISPGNAQAASGSAKGKPAVVNLYGQPASPAAASSPSSGSSTQVEAASIAGTCGLVIAVGGIAWHRRRNRIQPQ